LLVYTTNRPFGEAAACQLTIVSATVPSVVKRGCRTGSFDCCADDDAAIEAARQRMNRALMTMARKIGFASEWLPISAMQDIRGGSVDNYTLRTILSRLATS